MSEVTMTHVIEACRWARTAAAEERPLDGTVRRYDQSNWDCGTACCIWGAAHILAGNGPATQGPPPEWIKQAGKKLVADTVDGKQIVHPDPQGAEGRCDECDGIMAAYLLQCGKCITCWRTLYVRALGGKN